jgi:glucose-6-phosphate dehydrogenase assembly protein OpcA
VSSSVIFPAQPEQILKGLGKLWTQLGEEEKGHGKPTVLRACAMTLIIATDAEDGSYTASQTISELMKNHPSRGIVLVVSETAEHDLEARVLAQCWKPFGKAQQICCEEIEITAKPDSWPNVGPTLIGLVAADLPVIFWCRHNAALRRDARAAQKEGLAAIVGISHKVIFDSREMPPQDALWLIEGWQKQHRVVADLDWTRLTPWREPICHLFENEKRDNPFSKFRKVEIEHTEEQPSLGAFYMAAWLSGAYKSSVTFRQAKGFGPGVHRIILRSENETIEFGRSGAECAILTSTNGLSGRYNFGEPSLTTLMTEELSVAGNDPAFNTVVVRARELAEAY